MKSETLETIWKMKHDRTVWKITHERIWKIRREKCETVWK